MLAVFTAAAKGILAVMGEDSFLRSTVPCRVNIEYGVDEYGEYGEVTLTRTVATIDATLLPKTGDLLTHPDGTFKLDRRMRDSGVVERWVVIKA
jgi:hypothetical protein